MTEDQRLELITKIEDINELVHRMDRHVVNLESDLERCQAENRELNKMLHHADLAVKPHADLMTYAQIVEMVWFQGASAYAAEVQVLVDKVRPRP